jgi:hypothetical protein
MEPASPGQGEAAIKGVPCGSPGGSAFDLTTASKDRPYKEGSVVSTAA